MFKTQVLKSVQSCTETLQRCLNQMKHRSAIQIPLGINTRLLLIYRFTKHGSVTRSVHNNIKNWLKHIKHNTFFFFTLNQPVSSYFFWLSKCKTTEALTIHGAQNSLQFLLISNVWIGDAEWESHMSNPRYSSTYSWVLKWQAKTVIRHLLYNLEQHFKNSTNEGNKTYNS